MSPQEPHVAGVVKVAFVLWAAFWILCIALTAVASLPYNPLSMRFGVELGIRSLLPEGWGFFTRDPREVDHYLYERGAEGWRAFPGLPIAAPRNAFGIDRRPRAVRVELHALLQEVPEEAWYEGNAPFAALAPRLAPIAVTNRNEEPSICGAVGVLVRPPVPWAWADAGDEVGMPSRAAVLEVRCEAD